MLSSLEDLLAIVGLKVTTASIRTAWYMFGDLEGRVPDFRGCNAETTGDE